VILESIVLDYETTLSEFPKTFEKRHQSYQFNYTSPTFTAIEKITFQVKLEGFDTDWIDKGNQRFTIYTNLPEGDYVFKVKAKNGDRMVTENETLYAFTVPTPWFKTWWAYSLLFIFIAGLSSSSYWFQREALRRKKEEEMAMAQLKFDAERERLKRESSEAKARELETEFELEIQRRVADEERNEREKEKLSAQSFAEGIEKERSRIARELHDQILGSLSSIMRRIQIESKRTTNYEQLMEKLHTLLMELDTIGHDIRNIMDDLKPGSLEFFSLADTLESLLQKQTDLALQYIKTSIRTPKVLPELSPYQNVTIYRIFQEGIHNAIKHANPSEISIEIVELPDKKLRFLLRNNGTGFNVQQTLSQVNQTKSKSGNGLINMLHRAQTINGEIHWTSNDTFTELELIIPIT
jgi:signal transduction histidine kinase